MADIAASSTLLGSIRSWMLVKPSALTKSRFDSEYTAWTPSLGFQLTRWRCACMAAAADSAVRTVRRVTVIVLTILRGGPPPQLFLMRGCGANGIGKGLLANLDEEL